MDNIETNDINQYFKANKFLAWSHRTNKLGCVGVQFRPRQLDYKDKLSQA